MNHGHTKGSWINRNWKWLLAFLLTGAAICSVALSIALFLFVTNSFKSSEPYAHAISEARRSDEVIRAIGEPIHEGWLITGSVNTTDYSYSDSSGEAMLEIPISGPKGDAVIHVQADLLGEWRYERLVVVIKNGRHSVDLLKGSE